jgi:methyl-accepting chemotaxis protein
MPPRCPPIGEIASNLDLSRRISLSIQDTAFNEEAGVMAQALNTLRDNQHSTLTQVSGNTMQISNAVIHPSASAQQVAQRSEQQSCAAAAMASAMEEMTANLAEIASNAGFVDQASKKSGEGSRLGGSIIGRATAEMGAISETVHIGSMSIEGLAKQSERIYAIVQVIRDIDDQAGTAITQITLSANHVVTGVAEISSSLQQQGLASQDMHAMSRTLPA